MTLRDIISKLLPGKVSPEKQLKELVKQIDTAMEDLKVRTGEALAGIAALERKLSQAEMQNGKNSDERLAMLNNSLVSEKAIVEGLKTIFAELHGRKQEIELAIEQNKARQRKAATNELLAAVYRNFGSDLKLNNYLEKVSSNALKIEYTAESNLKIELLNNKTGQ